MGRAWEGEGRRGGGGRGPRDADLLRVAAPRQLAAAAVAAALAPRRRDEQPLQQPADGDRAAGARAEEAAAQLELTRRVDGLARELGVDERGERAREASHRLDGVPALHTRAEARHVDAAAHGLRGGSGDDAEEASMRLARRLW